MRTKSSTVFRCLNSKRILTAIGALALFAFLLGISPQPALAQVSVPGGGVDDSNGVFQLEGNATTDTGICFGITAAGPIIATPGAGNSCSSGTFVKFGSQTEDWDKIFLGTSISSANTGIVNDPFSSNSDDIFTGGATKDISDFSGWLWKNGKPQPKDDFEHGYAAAYTRSSDSHVIIVAGVDRYSVSGSSTAGFWFVQDPNVGSGVTTPTACTISSGCPFGGTHKDGDFLIISQFTVGGAVSTIQVFVWSGGAGGSITGPFTTIGTSPALSAGQCDPRTGQLGLCGTVNGAVVPTGGWAFTPESHKVAANNFDVGSFLEIGLDLTGLFQGLGKPLPCISKFFAESRSSGTGISSTLSDFIPPTHFPLCGISDTKTCTGAAIQSDGATVAYGFSGTISNIGIATLTSVGVTDVPNNGSGFTNLVVNQPGLTTLTAKGTTNSSTTYSGSFDTTFTSSTLPNTATASGTTPEGVVLTHDASWLTGKPPVLPSNCVPAPSGMLALTKTCSTTVASGTPLLILVTYSGTITNNANVLVSNITITDASTGSSNASTITITCGLGCTGSGNGSFNLAPNGVANYSGSFDTDTCTPEVSGRCDFQDTVNASGTGALGAGLISALPMTAHCALCPNGTCQ